jgi:hypothetical protein
MRRKPSSFLGDGINATRRSCGSKMAVAPREAGGALIATWRERGCDPGFGTWLLSGIRPKRLISGSTITACGTGAACGARNCRCGVAPTVDRPNAGAYLPRRRGGGVRSSMRRQDQGLSEAWKATVDLDARDYPASTET